MGDCPGGAEQESKGGLHMPWSIEEAAYYRRQGAPKDQTALVQLLKEVQQESGGQIPAQALAEIAALLGIRESFLSAVVKRIPSLRLADSHCLELCGGVNCSRRAALASFVEKTYGAKPEGFTVKTVPCMRMCGKGPNVRWDGKPYSQMDEARLRRLIEEGGI